MFASRFACVSAVALLSAVQPTCGCPSSKTTPAPVPAAQATGRNIWATPRTTPAAPPARPEAPPVTGRPPAPTEEECFRLRKAKEALLLSGAQGEWRRAFTELRRLPGGVEALLDCADQLRGQEGKPWRGCVEVLVEMFHAAPADFPDRGVPHLIAALEDTRNEDPVRQIEFIGKLGRRARGALPALRKRRDGGEQVVALAAFRAIMQIEGRPQATHD